MQDGLHGDERARKSRERWDRQFINQIRLIGVEAGGLLLHHHHCSFHVPLNRLSERNAMEIMLYLLIFFHPRSALIFVPLPSVFFPCVFSFLSILLLIPLQMHTLWAASKREWKKRRKSWLTQCELVSSLTPCHSFEGKRCVEAVKRSPNRRIQPSVFGVVNHFSFSSSSIKIIIILSRAMWMECTRPEMLYSADLSPFCLSFSPFHPVLIPDEQEY